MAYTYCALVHHTKMSTTATPETTTSQPMTAETTRLCKPCGIEMPVSNFPAGARRFACKKCTHQRAQKSRKTPTADERRQRLAWTCCFKTAISVFNQKAIGVSHLNIQQIFNAAGYVDPTVRSLSCPQCSLQPACVNSRGVS